MGLSGLLPFLEQTEQYQQLLGSLAKSGHGGSVQGTLPAAIPFFLAALQRSLNRPLFVILAREDAAFRFYEQIRVYSESPQRVLFYPSHDALAYERLPADVEKIGQRLQVLGALAGRDSGCDVSGAVSGTLLAVASARSLTQLTMAPGDLANSIESVCVGQRFSIAQGINRWVAAGYEPAAQVEERGTFARRGGIVDIFPSSSDKPVRIELFGDEVDSLRLFDPATQRSESKVERVLITPPTEVPLWRAGEALRRLEVVDAGNCRPEVREEWQRILATLEQGAPFEGIESLLEAFTGQPFSVLDHLPQDALVVIVSPDQVRLSLSDLERQALELRMQFEEQGELPLHFPESHMPLRAAAGRLEGRDVLSLGASSDFSPHAWTARLDAFEPASTYAGQLKRFVGDVRQSLASKETLIVVSPQAERLRDLFEERDLFPVLYKRQVGGAPQAIAAGALSVFHEDLAEGWRSGQLGLTVWTDAEIFGWSRPIKRVTRTRRAPTEAFSLDLNPGDYVVHMEHGIARYEGLAKMSPNGEERDYLLLQYNGNDRLYVPVDQLDRITPYVGLGPQTPTLSRLGTVEWSRTKRRVKKSVADLAKELIELYSAREAVKGYAFTPDSNWQREMEDAFPYVETEDQLRAVTDVKRDMEQPRPMDRLICGDVGYGKTEVAVRAAFKAANDGKQVAVLVPTTVLAQQHYNTFQQRLSSFPVEVEMLSRFRSRKEQQEIIQRIKDGKVDIVVGTHRLLQKDVRFKDLGLVIVDEEQRFGVRHKETLKQLRREVDVLTLTATPIPRTLHMALTGVRDMSVIETPPEQRLPIKTYVTAYGDQLVREVVLREMSRGGQIYYVHNRVQSMPHVLRHLQELIPEARITVGHGQMDEGHLERVMMDFVDGKYDILLCTTIIESGLDIPNVNTLIVDDATHFGLAQLYQLRGRVGRSSDRAYAYFLYDETRPVTEAGQQRLETIQEATELGAGFRVAMKDLEIRGAGNLLGPEQHGHVAAVGFDLYTRLLAHAVEEFREGRPVPEEEEEETISLDLPLSARLPSDYVDDEALRLKLYREVARLSSAKEISEFRTGLQDRFGPVPVPVDNLLYLMRLKLTAAKAGLSAISASNGEFVLMIRPSARLNSSVAEHAKELQISVRSNQLRVKRAALGADWKESLYNLVDDMAN